jgi:23S rRNA pseudouridine1911/1915/1917 synthase
MRPPGEDPPGPPAELVVASSHSGLTLAAVVRELLPGTSWSRARDLCRQGRVTVDGYLEDDPARRVAAGERIAVRLTGQPVRRELLGADALVHVDSEVAVVRKPAGLLSVPFEEEDRDTLVTLARTAIARREPGRGPGPRLRVVQRLDKETSGLLVFARTVAAERHLQAQFRQHSVTRRYLALVHGETADATYDTLLVPDRGDGLRGSWGVFRRARGKPPETARNAVTHVEVEEVLAGATLVSCRLETGRQHQIRIHLAEAGHPLVGEKVYVRDYAGALLPAPRPMLHAAELGFVHPRSGREMRFEEPPPADFLEVLDRLRIKGKRGRARPPAPARPGTR